MRKTIKTGILLLFIVSAFLTVAQAQTDYAVVTEVDAPDTVKPGETITVTVTVEYNFEEQTYCLIGIYDTETWEPITEMEYEDQGNYEAEFEFELTAPDEEGSYELAADMYFMSEEGMVYTEGSEEYFTVTVKSAGGAIPGFPTLSVLMGSLVAYALVSRRNEL